MNDGNNEGRSEIQNFKYLENKKSILDEIQSFLHNYLRANISWSI